jgi:DNA-binding MarR family transcriptional regulator
MTSPKRERGTATRASWPARRQARARERAAAHGPRGQCPDTSARNAPENLGVPLREPFRALTDHIHERLAQNDHPEVRPAHGAVLQYLDDDCTRVSVLAERAQMSKQSMAELVLHLEAHGYVERVSDPTDRRAKLVRLTRRGRAAIPVARAAIAEHEWTRRLGREEDERAAQAPARAEREHRAVACER